MHPVPEDPTRSEGSGRIGPADPLDGARDRGGRSPRTWMHAALRGTGRPLVTWSPGPGALGVVVDGTFSDGAGADPLADHGTLPLPSRSVPSVALEMCLPSVTGLDELFAEVRRILRPAGTVAALVPVRASFLAGRDVWRTLERSTGGRPRFRNESARDNLHWLFAAADFAVLTDQRRTFRLPVPHRSAAASAVKSLVVGGVWPPDLEPGRLDRARQALADRAGPGCVLPLQLRLLVARR